MAALGRVVIGTVIEGDAEPNVNLPASHPDFLDEKSEEVLTPLEVEAVKALHNLPGEGFEAAAEAVVSGQLVPLRDQVFVLRAELLAAELNLLGATLQLGELHQAGLVEVDQTLPLFGGVFELA